MNRNSAYTVLNLDVQVSRWPCGGVGELPMQFHTHYFLININIHMRLTCTLNWSNPEHNPTVFQLSLFFHKIYQRLHSCNCDVMNLVIMYNTNISSAVSVLNLPVWSEVFVWPVVILVHSETLHFFGLLIMHTPSMKSKGWTVLEICEPHTNRQRLLELVDRLSCCSFIQKCNSFLFLMLYSSKTAVWCLPIQMKE